MLPIIGFLIFGTVVSPFITSCTLDAIVKQLARSHNSNRIIMLYFHYNTINSRLINIWSLIITSCVS